MNVLKDMQEIFREIFDDEVLLITKETTAKDIEDWDSLAQMNLIIAMEKHFKVKFKIDEIVELKKVGDLEVLINAKLLG